MFAAGSETRGSAARGRPSKPNRRIGDSLGKVNWFAKLGGGPAVVACHDAGVAGDDLRVGEIVVGDHAPAEGEIASLPREVAAQCDIVGRSGGDVEGRPTRVVATETREGGQRRAGVAGDRGDNRT